MFVSGSSNSSCDSNKGLTSPVDILHPNQQKINRKALVAVVTEEALTWTRCNIILLIFSVDPVTKIFNLKKPFFLHEFFRQEKCFLDCWDFYGKLTLVPPLAIGFELKTSHLILNTLTNSPYLEFDEQREMFFLHIHLQ